MWLFMLQYHGVLITITLWYNLKSGRFIPPALFFFSQDCLDNLEFFQFGFPQNFRIICSTSMKNVMGYFDGDCIVCRLLWVSMAILTILILPAQEHEVFFH